MPAFAFLPARPLISLCLGCVLALACAGRGAAQKIKIEAYPDLDAPYVSTPPKVVAAMLRLADAKPGDIVSDLGSGDGRIVLAAVRDFGVGKAIGVDLNPERVAEARAKARVAGVADRAVFVHGDVFKFDFGEATVLTLYLLPHINLRLRPRVLALRPGTRVVSHDFSMGKWTPDRHVRIGTRDVFLWIVPAKVAGRWRLGSYRLDLRQTFQRVSGVVRTGSAAVTLRDGGLYGRRLRFTAVVGGKGLLFDGDVQNDRMAGALNGKAIEGRRLH